MSINQRVSIRRKRPNPLFQEWLEELYEEAQRTNSRLEYMLREALDSLSKYPIPLKTGAECEILKGFHKKLCLFLDKRLEVHYINHQAIREERSNNTDTIVSIDDHEPEVIEESNSLANGQERQSSDAISTSNGEQVLPTTNESSNSVLNVPSTSNSDSQESVTSSTSSTTTTYKPAHRSGGYAILIALMETQQEYFNRLVYVTKDALIEKAKMHTDESLLQRECFTPWSSMSRLLAEGLVIMKKSIVMTYGLTDQGVEIAEQLLEESAMIPTMTPNSEVAAAVQSESHSSVEDYIELPGGSYDIVLLIDKNETGGVNKKNDPTVAQFNKYPDLLHEYRSLKVGDFMWIARHKVNKDQELVLPYVIERKRLDDLGHSIIDGRYHEQKFRLRKCGLKNVIYMVEYYAGVKRTGLPICTLQQAEVNTRVHDGFKIRVTDNLSHSVRFVAMMTKRIIVEFKDHPLKGSNSDTSDSTDGVLMTFNIFSKLASKNRSLTVTETFIKLLLQLKGVSVEKALAITKVYRTPKALMRAYEDCNESDRSLLLANIKYGSNNRNVGPSVSKALYHIFSMK